MTTYAPSNTVSTADTADNVIVADVVGNKTDTVGGDSLVAIGKQILAAGVLRDAEIDDMKAGEYGIITLPIGAASITCTDSNGSGAYSQGTYVELIASTAADYKIVGIFCDTPSAAMVARLYIGVGAGAAEVDYVCVPIEISTDAGAFHTIMVPPTGRIPAASRLAVALATLADSGQTLNIGAIVQQVS